MFLKRARDARAVSSLFSPRGERVPRQIRTEQKARPRPVKIRARASERLTLASASRISATMDGVSALSEPGRSNVSVATPPSY